MRLAIACAVASTLLASCGDDDAPIAPPLDGAAVDAPDGGDVPFATTPPAPPEPPRIACPAGWRENVQPNRPAGCDPWPETGAAACADHEIHLPGTPGCARIGTSCPADGWPEGLPAGVTVVHVQPGAPAGGDGSRGAPFDRLVLALAAARAGDVIALSAGTYDEPIRPLSGVTLWGACPERTVLRSSIPDAELGVVQLSDVTGVVLRNLSIASSARAAVRADASAVTIEDVSISDVETWGVAIAYGSNVTLRNVAIRRARPSAADGIRLAFGVVVAYGSTASIERVSIEEAHGAGVLVTEAASAVTVRDVAIRRTEPNVPGGSYGIGLQLDTGSSGDIERLVVEQSHTTGLAVHTAGTTARIADLVVRDSRPRASDGALGRGVTIESGGVVEAARVWIERTHEVGVLVGGAGAALTADDVVVLETRAQATNRLYGRAIAVQSGARATLRRVHAQDQRDVGIMVAQPGTDIVLEDATVIDTHGSAETGSHGWGFGVQEGARAVLRRARIVRSHQVGAVVTLPGSASTFEDVEILETLPQPNLHFGRALQVQLNASAALSRVRIEDCYEVALLAADDASVDATDLDIQTVRPGACVSTDCADNPGGIGVGAYGAARIAIDRFVVSGADLCGVQIAADGELDLSEGEVTRTQIGACVQVDGYDFARLTDRVRYTDNEQSVESTTLPVPDTSTP